jgi:hypothetical protein
VARGWLKFLALLSVFAAAGCNDSSTNVVAPDPPPYVVDGVYSVTGDGLVTIYWRPNQESDIASYRVYRNSAPTGTFTLIGSSTTTQYMDHDVVNGTTYFYAVAAVDRAGQESPELSYENVFDTPRPEGFDAYITNDVANSTASGWDFSAALARPSADSRIDMYYAHVDQTPDFLIFATSGTDIQDAGYVPLVDVDFAPPAGWSTDGIVEAIVGHSYLVFTRDNHYAKFEVTAVGNSGVQFNWAYQIDPGNPELARKVP